MSVSTCPGPTEGSWSTSPTIKQRRFVGDRRQQRPHEQNIDHRGLVDHQQPAIERVLAIAFEPAGPGIDLEQAMDGLRFETGGLAHPLRGPPGRSAKQVFHALGRQDAQDRVDDRRLADARPAGNHRDLRGERRPDGIGLAACQREPGSLFHPGQRLVRIDPGPWRFAGGNVENAPADRALGPVQAAEEYAGGLAHRVSDHRAVGQLQVQNGADQLRGDLKELGRERPQLLFRQAAMALVHRLGQRMADARPDPDHGCLLDAEFHGDGVGRHEADAADVAGEPVGVLRHDLDGVRAVGPEYPNCPCRADAVAVQEHHDLADDLLLGPGVGDPLRPHPADAGHLAQPFRLRLDDIEHLFAECADQLSGVDRTDAPDHARAEIFLDALDRGGRGGADETRPELLAVGAVVDPFARGGDPFSRRHRRGVTDHRDQVAMAARPGPEHAEANLRIVEGDALDRPGQDLPVRRSRLPAGAGLHDVPSAGEVSSSLTNSKRRASAAEALRSSNSGS